MGTVINKFVITGSRPKNASDSLDEKRSKVLEFNQPEFIEKTRLLAKDLRKSHVEMEEDLFYGKIFRNKLVNSGNSANKLVNCAPASGILPSYLSLEQICAHPAIPASSKKCEWSLIEVRRTMNPNNFLLHFTEEFFDIVKGFDLLF